MSTREVARDSKPAHLRVVMTIAFPTATFLSVLHMSRFIFASTPVENSSMRITDGLPVKNKDYELLSRAEKAIILNIKPTNKGNGKRELPLVPPRKLARQTVPIPPQPTRDHDRIDVPPRLLAPP